MTREISLPLTAGDVEAISERLNEPDWLRQHRQDAWALAESMPMPTTNDEPWRRTDLRGVHWNDALRFAAAPSGSLNDVPDALYEPLIGDKQGGLLVFVNGRLVLREFSDELAAQGVIFTDLTTAAREHPDLVRQYFMTQGVLADEGKFAALHAALWTHGVFLYVPADTSVELPLHSVEYAPSGETTSMHILAVLGDGAKATYLHESASPNREGQAIHFGATELIVGDNATLHYVALQNWDENTYNFGHQRGRVGAAGHLDWVAGEMGTRLTKLFMTIDLDGDDAFGRLSGLYFPHNRQHLDLDTQQNHHALRQSSDLLFKGALKEDSRSVWQGMILVDRGAQQTDGFQANRNLLLDSRARADSIPGLEIQADDVRCTHAATIGKVDEVEVFYLMARGIPRDEAIKLIVHGFFDPIMQRIPFEEVRERLLVDIDAKLAQQS